MKSRIFMPLSRIIIVISVLIVSQNIYCQEQETLKKDRKNSIKVNVTNPMLFGENNYILGYEHTIGAHQSFSVNIGTFQLGRLFNINTDSIKSLNKNITSRGISLSGDYRFYLAKENKYKSPHGIYIGPYLAMNSYNRKFDLEVTTPSADVQLDLDFGFRVATIGFQLGYQFIFWDRVLLDMVLFGPGLSFYKLKTELSTSLDPDQESELFQKINEKLSEKIPGYSLVIKPGIYERTGSVNTTSAGYRYIVMVGYRF